MVAKQVNFDVLTPGEAARGLGQVVGAQERAVTIGKIKFESFVEAGLINFINRELALARVRRLGRF